MERERENIFFQKQEKSDRVEKVFVREKAFCFESISIFFFNLDVFPQSLPVS